MSPGAAPPELPAVALLTCRALGGLTPDDQLLVEPLRAHGLEAVPVQWDDPATDWRAFEAAVVRSTWDYHVRPAAFRAWIDRLEAQGIPLWNPPAVLRWNLHKGYLRDLEERGVPVVPTVWLRRGQGQALEDVLRERGWSRAVVKPAVSAGARRTRLVELGRGTGADERVLRGLLRHGDVLVQPFLQAVHEEGEWSFLFFGGSFSHAVLKRPAAGDFRVQERFGGSAAPARPAHSLVELAAAVLDAASGAVRDDQRSSESPDLLYARVDAVCENGRFLLVELEVLEPSMFLAADPGAPGRFARALAARCGRAGAWRGESG